MVHGVRMLRGSGLYLNGEEGTLFPQNDMVLYGMCRPTVILGTLLLVWVTKPYSDINDPGKGEFSYKLSSCRMVMDCMFGKLKAHWHCLCLHLDANVANAVCIIVDCCILRNICEGKGACFHPEWDQDKSVRAAGSYPLAH